ncbi:MAG: N-formylglutamate amidohydrolase [Alphaproteobacteria bacterium]
MDLVTTDSALFGTPIEILKLAVQTAPVVFSSPHSGRDYPADMVDKSRLSPSELRRSEDCFIDELFGDVPRFGAPLLRALFPRAYVDPNREPFELDPGMFSDALPDYVNTRSPRVFAGLGTVARVVANGSDIYAEKLQFAEARWRIDSFYRPYHDALADLIHTTKATFGYCLLIDCHSMPSVCGPMEHNAGRRRRVDMVLGDALGGSCTPGLTGLVEEALREMGYTVARNAPYSGGYITRHYGRPHNNVHTLQVEINRALYMDEERFERLPEMARLRTDLSALAERLCGAGQKELAA